MMAEISAIRIEPEEEKNQNELVDPASSLEFRDLDELYIEDIDGSAGLVHVRNPNGSKQH